MTLRKQFVPNIAVIRFLDDSETDESLRERGDLGTSLFYQTPIVEELGPRIPATFELAILAGCVSILLALPLGALSAVKQNSALDYAARLFTFTGISIPIFVTGLVMVYLLVQLFNWFPPLGYAVLWEY